MPLVTNPPTQDNTTGTPDQKPVETNPAPEANKPAPDAAKPAEGEKPPEEKKPEGAPEKYDFKLEEGFTLEASMQEKFSSMAKELNLSQEKAQKFVDLATELQKQNAKAQADHYEKIRDEWVSKIKADKEFGGQKFDETIVRANRALKRFGSPELSEFLDQSGYGDNPEVIKMLARIDRGTGEDKTENGQPGGKVNPKTAAEVIYGG